MAENKLWKVELHQTQTRELMIEAPDPASRDALAYGLMRLMDEGKALPPSVEVVRSERSTWERGNTGEVTQLGNDVCTAEADGFRCVMRGPHKDHQDNRGGVWQ